MADNENKGERKKEFKTVSQLDIEPFYDSCPEDFSLELPGSWPYTRGIYPNMYRGRLWTMRQYAGFGSAEESNRRYRYLLEQGVTGLSIAFDLPTQMGIDPDEERAEGEVGRVGVSIASIEDMRVLLAGIPLEKVSISMTINATASILLAFLLAYAKEQGVSWNRLRGTIQNDILKEYIARGTYIFPPEPALRLVADIFAFCADNVPKFNTISVSGYHMREAGCTAQEELGFTLANGITYIEKAIEAGLDVDQVAPRMSFFFNCHNSFLEEIAKFRAARRLWAKLVRDRFSPKNDRSCMLRFHTQTAGSSLTAQQCLNNVVRTAIQALAAVLGGTQSLHTNAYDEALGLPTEASAQLALRTQQIIAYETGVADTVDPLGGSYLIEHWTNRLEKLALDIINEIDDVGGMMNAINNGYPQRRIANSAYEYQRRIENNDITIVGVNDFVGEDPDIPVFKLDHEIAKKQIDRIKRFKQKRDNRDCLGSLERVRQCAKSGANIMPALIDAVENNATIGEISNVLAEVFGRYSPPDSF